MAAEALFETLLKPTSRNNTSPPLPLRPVRNRSFAHKGWRPVRKIAGQVFEHDPSSEHPFRTKTRAHAATSGSPTVARLAELGVRVHCLALSGVDLTSSTGKLTMGVINAAAEFERDLLVERTQAGLSRAKAEGKTLGRPPSLTDDQRKSVEQRLREGAGASALAREFKTSRYTIIRVRDAMPAP